MIMKKIRNLDFEYSNIKDEVFVNHLRIHMLLKLYK